MERLISSPSSFLLPSRTAAIARPCLPLFHLATAALGASSNRPLLPFGGQTGATAHLHTTVVVNCTFRSNPNIRNSSGKLLLYAYYSSPCRCKKIITLSESLGSYHPSLYIPPFQYDYLYCSSSLYEDLNTRWIREWMAYHAHFFGPRSHFPGLPYPERLASLSLPSMPVRCSPIRDARHWSQRLDSAAAGCMREASSHHDADQGFDCYAAVYYQGLMWFGRISQG